MYGNWNNTSSISGFSFLCGYCGNSSGPSKNYKCNREYSPGKSTVVGRIYICPTCNRPTFIERESEMQIPGPKIGEVIKFLPQEVEELYEESRSCISVNAYTSSVLACRKLLMNVAVTKGADEGESFFKYVNYLKDNHYIPPGSEEWVDHIRKKGNEATHEIPSISKEDAIELLDFTEMLLRFVYEMPGRMQKYTQIEE